MKILISNDNPFAHYYIRLAIARVFSYMGHEAIIWDINQKPAFDAFDEFEPDIFIGQTYNLTKSVAQCIKERPHLRVVMKASDWGSFNDVLDLTKYPVLVANQNEIDRVLELHRETGKPDYVQVHYADHRLDHTHGHWRDNGIRVESQLNAADIFDFYNGKVKPEYQTDVMFVGGRWGYKSRTLDKYLLPLCRPDSKVKVKIFGNQPWGVPQYAGFLPSEEMKHAFASATICPNVSEPHSQVFGYDIVERPFKLLANKCFVLSDYVEDLATLIPDGIEYAKSPEEFLRKVDYYLKYPQDRLDYIENGHKAVMENHTYFQRVRDMLTRLDMVDEAERCMVKFEEAVAKLGK